MFINVPDAFQEQLALGVLGVRSFRLKIHFAPFGVLFDTRKVVTTQTTGAF